MAPFPGLPGLAGTRKVKPIWILLKQETVSGSGISWAICKSAPRPRQITTPKPHHSFFTGRMPFLPPNQQRQSTSAAVTVSVKGKNPYSTAERRVPKLIPVLGSEPAGDTSHKPGGWLPLLSARPAARLQHANHSATEPPSASKFVINNTAE